MPGYLAFYLLRWLSFLERKWSDRDILYLSLIFSVVIYSLTGYLFHVQDFNEIKNIILNPGQACVLLGITFSLGLFPGLIARWWLSKNAIYPGNVWETVLDATRKDAEDTWLLVYTIDGKEYKGTLSYYDAGEEPNALSIRRPIQIIRDENYFVKEEFNVGKEIIFKDKDISRIVLFKEY